MHTLQYVNSLDTLTLNVTIFYVFLSYVFGLNEIKKLAKNMIKYKFRKHRNIMYVIYSIAQEQRNKKNNIELLFVF